MPTVATPRPQAADVQSARPRIDDALATQGHNLNLVQRPSVAWSGRTGLASRIATGAQQRHHTPEVDGPTHSEHLRTHDVRVFRRPESLL